jgi:hypothetical protein
MKKKTIRHGDTRVTVKNFCEEVIWLGLYTESTKNCLQTMT